MKTVRSSHHRILKNLIFFLLFISHFKTFGQAQNTTIDTRSNTVIAVSGLNIREKPDKHAKVVGKIPFGHQILYQSNQSFGVDTIKDYQDIFDDYVNNAPKQRYHFTGNWVKISYKGTTGFVLQTYLLENKEVERIKKFDTNEYALLFPYSSCYINFYTPNKFNWYGIYSNGEGKFELKKINISYFTTDDGLILTRGFGVAAENNKGLVAIIGSKKALKQSIKNCFTDSYYSYKRDTSIINKLKKYGVEPNYSKKSNHIQGFKITSANKSQIIDYQDINGNEQVPELVKFIGDLDGDDKLDYIFDTGDKGGYLILYLSSKRKGNKLVEAVAFFYRQFCC